MTTEHSPVHDVRDADFERAVIGRSHQVPVVVDFWAPWCGPCRQLGPVLERLAVEGAGAWELVKLNTDENPRTATQYRIQGIPAVKAFRDGRVVAEFTGAIPEAQVRAFLARIGPSEADTLAASAAEMEASGFAATAEDRYGEALAKQPDHPKALLGLARLLAARGATEAALRLLDRRPADAAVQALRAQIALQAAAGGVDLEALRRRVAADPKDAAAHYDLGRALAAEGDHATALDHLLTAVRLDRSLDDDGARRAMLDIFALLGDDDERTQDYRRQLSLLLF